MGKFPACDKARLIEPPIHVYYLAWIFDPSLKAKRVIVVTSNGMTKTDREVRLGIDRVDRWGRVHSCCVGHARQEFANDRGVSWFS